MSEQYIVSARKYRPQTFDTVVGQSHITTTLKNAIKTKQLAHAYLFCGPRGVGKTTCARILAKTINCENPTTDIEACGKCDTCLSFKDNASMNIFELDAASHNSVDDIRNLTEQVRYAPQRGKYKIYIIDEVHMLTTSAFNAFLKTLEEPPPYAIFILATTEKHKILPTILSRCQIFDFKRIQSIDIVNHMASIAKIEDLQFENPALHVIAQKSEGCMRDALSMMDRISGFTEGKLSYGNVIEHLNILDAETYFKFSEMLWVKDTGAALLFLDEKLQNGFEGDIILNGFAEHFRNLLLSKDLKTAKLLDLPEEHRKQYFEHAQIIPEPYVLSALSLLNQAELQYKSALNKRLHLEINLIRLAYLVDLTIPSSMINMEGAKKKLTELPKEPVSHKKYEQTKPEMERPQAKVSESLNDVVEIQTKASNPEKENPKPKQENQNKTETKEPETLTGPPKLKRGGNILEQIQNANRSRDREEEKLLLDQELSEKLMEDYKSFLSLTPQELPAINHLNMTGIKCVSETEIQLVCNSEINLAYAQNKSVEFREFCREKTKNKNIRITTFLDSSAKVVVKERILSKMEIFDVIASRNPNFRILRNALRLEIE